jgi:hypothetical protein
VLAERASGHGKNVLVALRFVFGRVSHHIGVLSYSNAVKAKIDLAKRRPKTL